VVAHLLQLLTLNGSSVPVPTLLMSLGAPRRDPGMEQLFRLLLDLGWVLAAAPLTVPTTVTEVLVATLNIAATAIRLRTQTEVNNGMLLDLRDVPSEVPAGWWDAAERAGQCCTVILVDVLRLRRGSKMKRHLDGSARMGTVLIGGTAVTGDWRRARWPASGQQRGSAVSKRLVNTADQSGAVHRRARHRVRKGPQCRRHGPVREGGPVKRHSNVTAPGNGEVQRRWWRNGELAAATFPFEKTPDNLEQDGCLWGGHLQPRLPPAS
jgi:hypothetical protein